MSCADWEIKERTVDIALSTLVPDGANQQTILEHHSKIWAAPELAEHSAPSWRGSRSGVSVLCAEEPATIVGLQGELSAARLQQEQKTKNSPKTKQLEFLFGVSGPERPGNEKHLGVSVQDAQERRKKQRCKLVYKIL